MTAVDWRATDFPGPRTEPDEVPLSAWFELDRDHQVVLAEVTGIEIVPVEQYRDTGSDGHRYNYTRSWLVVHLTGGEVRIQRERGWSETKLAELRELAGRLRAAVEEWRVVHG